MNSPQAALGIDTSAYTTSVALLSLDGTLLAEERAVLTVAAGERGLRQSEAVFQHVRKLPVLLEQVMGERPPAIAAVAASTAPRPVPDSYMPVFKVGEAVGRSVAAPLAFLSCRSRTRKATCGLVCGRRGGWTRVPWWRSTFPAAPRSSFARHTPVQGAGRWSGWAGPRT